MAERQMERKASVYRSVSFKKLESWSAKKRRSFGEDLERCGALPPDAAEATLTVTVSRKVSKISAASLSTADLKKACHGISPSVRKLSEKFCLSSSGNTGSVQNTTSLVKSADESSSHDSGCLSKEFLEPTSEKLKHSNRYCPTQESVSGSDSDRGEKRTILKTLGCTRAGSPTCQSHRSYHPSYGETIHVDANWPSVTKIRELFGDGSRKQHRSTSDADDLKSACHHLQHSFDAKDSTLSSDKSVTQPSHLPTGPWQDTNSSDHDNSTLYVDCLAPNCNRYHHLSADYSCEFSSGTSCLNCDLPTNNSGTQSPISIDLQQRSPPEPTPRSRASALPLRSHSFAHHWQLQEHRKRAEQPQPPDSLHSSHNSSKPQTGPSVEIAGAQERLSSGEENEESSRWTEANTILTSDGITTHFPQNKHAYRAKLREQSSGSEEDSPASLAHHNRDVRRRSLRKKKKSSCSRDNEDSDDSDNQPVMMEHLESSSDSQPVSRRSEGFRSRGCFTGLSWTRDNQSTCSHVSKDTFSHFHRTFEGPAAGSPVPQVSRVSKVTIPSFIASPLGSRSSSRYSSTETLKEEDQPANTHTTGGDSSAVLSKTYHRNTTMYRSPSFGHGDNFSRAPVQVNSRLAPSLNPVNCKTGTLENRVFPHSLNDEKDKNRISMSNPDIASETLSLLSYLKTDLSELRMRKKGQDIEDSPSSEFQGSQGTSVYRMGSRAHRPHPGRPSLKDLTATLRRAKSFTYSEKPVVQRYYGSGPGLRSSSEQQLDCEGSGEQVVVPDREVESDDCRSACGYDEPMPAPLQDRYVQEARQVIRDICQMGEIKDDDDYEEDSFKIKKDEAKQDTELEDKANQERRLEHTVFTVCKEGETDRESGKCLQKGNSEENVFCDKSVDELSGHESSLTDEGIVTEPEVGLYGGLSCGKDLLSQTLNVWNQSGLYEELLPDTTLEESLSSQIPSVRTEYEGVAIGGDISSSKNVNQGALEAPSTPSTIRRRRKFSSAGNYGSESSNGSNGESNGESAYRSLSDPMPHRSCSIAEDSGKSFSMDSNLLGSLSLNSKVGCGVDSSAADLSEYTGSAASDLSLCSESLRDYSTVIQSIVCEPGAMDNLIDEKVNSKAVKKKSFSDPSRRGELAETVLEFQRHHSEPISELEQSIPPSSSEPILSEQRDELWALNNEKRQIYCTNRRPRSQSEHVLPSHFGHNGETKAEDEPSFPFDPKLAQVLSPCMSRRTSKKRTNRFTHQVSCDEGDHLEEQVEEPSSEDHPDSTSILPNISPPKARSKHVRHASEPATFVPIVPSNAHISQDLQRSGHVPESPPPLKIVQGEDAPSLQDVTEQYILALKPPEGLAETPTAPGGVAPEGRRSTPSVPTATAEPQLERKSSEELTTAPLKAKPRVDMRKHVIMTLLDTEQSYVESLRTLIQGYMKPLKHPESSPLCDPSLVDEMFYQIPEILEHHEQFLEQVLDCVNQWHDKQTVGHLLIQSFSKEILANIYSAYIDNFMNAKDAVRIAKEAKPAFLKFLEQSMRENKEKQALGDLMIKPVQRIPRYELLVKDLLKHTPEDHPDYSFLLDAQKNIKRLAERINTGRRSAEELERETRVMQEIEAHIEGIEHILNPQRKFLRQEMVVEAKTVGGKKDRSLFLFSDLLICTTLKRKSGSLRRSSMSLYSAASVIDTSSKYKFMWKLPLEDLEVVKGSNQATNRDNIQKIISRLDEDLSTLGQISKLSETLCFPHQSLDDVIKDLMASVHRELAEKQSLAFSMTLLPTKLELSTTSSENIFIFEFSSPDARSNFEQAFEEAKKKLAMNKDQWDPEFLKAIPIMKTRSGMQFSCASPSHSCPENTYEVWVCNSDGYVGQVCLLNIRDEPTVEACIAVCSARIICIAAVPGLKNRERVGNSTPSVPSESNPTASTQPQLHISISGSSLELSEPTVVPAAELVPFDSDDTDDEDSPSPSSTLQSQASHSTISSSFGNDEAAVSKDMATETTSSEEEQEFPVPSSFGAPRLSADSPMDGRAMRRSSRGSFTRASLEDLLSIDPEAYQSSVWLGTEDGCIHVYQSSDNIRNRKNSMKMQHSASILCILYLDNKVFVSLSNGEVIVYHREAGSFWDPQSSQTLCLGSSSGPVTKMVPVAGKLWCGCQNRVLIVNTSTLTQEHSFQVGQDSGRCVTSMVCYGKGVWIALQGSAQVRLYHASTYESLTEVDVAPAVHKMLAGSDAIIRQHKAACLRITALLACKDLLWIGTSAGVVLTLTIPPVSSGTCPGSLRAPLLPMGSAHGHTGHVRFLTCIELPEGFDVNFPPQSESVNSTQNNSENNAGGLQRQDSARRRASTLLPVKSNLLVISGGDGYEDFRLTNSSETVGRDDSTNHLLLWRV
ncbi:rho guanine nucleotide exchange factor 17-like isoform X2 [Myxocyprinus asiaticus]|uniref:rho guanine nucleotide exchange factor 17-like isoform X2 n=1 Tax=Myxocyprinus asiaticus TaxID=70543 RepID=UPI0022221F21|nr:rho guanine nucleotide exchange factor 17-like isoform X2 [Myxocyprinus asiaticus]